MASLRLAGLGQFLQFLGRLFKVRIYRTRRGIEQGFVFHVFQLRPGSGILGGNASGMLQKPSPGDFQELVQLGDPVAHGHGLALEGLKFGVFDVEVHDAVKHLQFVLGEVVLGHRRVFLADDAAGPGGFQPHEGLGGIGSSGDDFGSRVAMRGPVHLVLHGGKEGLRGLRVGRIIHTGGVDIEHLLVEAALRGADVADALQQFVEVIFLPLAWRVFEPLVIHGEPLHQILAQPGRGPLAELRASVTADAEADCENGGQIVVQNGPGNLPFALGSNY